MKTYVVNVNGNDYAVTVKHLDGTTAYVDIDGLEFEVAVSGNSVAKTSGPAPQRSTAHSAPPKEHHKRRSSALDTSAAPSAAPSGPTGKGVVAAHLPGLILSIQVNVGDTVKKDDVVCKMEAMKMENEVRAHVGGVVKEILVKVQQNVLENQALMVIE